jgi:hypothetical protein
MTTRCENHPDVAMTERGYRDNAMFDVPIVVFVVVTMSGLPAVVVALAWMVIVSLALVVPYTSDRELPRAVAFIDRSRRSRAAGVGRAATLGAGRGPT